MDWVARDAAANADEEDERADAREEGPGALVARQMEVCAAMRKAQGGFYRRARSYSANRARDDVTRCRTPPKRMR
jgi:hypothetical protein